MTPTMVRSLIDIITADDPALRDASLETVCAKMTTEQLLAECAALDAFRRDCQNLYQRVRALLFLYAIHRFVLPPRLVGNGRADAQAGDQAGGQSGGKGSIPFDGYHHLLERRFEEAIDLFLAAMKTQSVGDSISSALASAYKDLAFATLASQVRRSVRSVKGNQWMFRIGHPAEQPLRIRPELLIKSSVTGLYPILSEKTPVRMDLSHSAWSDIFFLGMDFPEGAKVLNVSIDLAVHGRDATTKPPVEAYLRVIDEPVLRLVSVDLGAHADITTLTEVFDFARDYLGLLKAAVIAAGIVPPGIEGSGHSLAELLGQIVGPGLGLEIVSSVNSIPKGSRLAVSTNLLASLISACMRATGQARSLTGKLDESERRLVAARAILGEWLGGSGGGWQDSGGVWPGMKMITGAAAKEGDPEFGISRGRLMPDHRILSSTDASPQTRKLLQDSLVLVHGGMAQNVGPILEMVTEKYLLRSAKEWTARGEALRIVDEILIALKNGNVQRVGGLTTTNFFEPLQTIIPWASTFYTETLIGKTKEHFGADFQGFWMLGGMSGGGMGFIFAPHRKAEAQQFLGELMSATRKQLGHALPFAMEPVVYDFAINENGTFAELKRDAAALLPAAYYAFMVPAWLRMDPRDLPATRRAELDSFGGACRSDPELTGMVQTLFDRLFPAIKIGGASLETLQKLLAENGFDAEQHERIRSDLKNDRIGLDQNRLPPSTVIHDVLPEDVFDATGKPSSELEELGMAALRRGEVGVISLAAGAGSRWTQGAGVVKALHPFCKFAGRHRTFIEVHLAKSQRIARLAGVAPLHIITASYLTQQPIENWLKANNNYNYHGPLFVSPGRSIGLRLVPNERDLRFAWEQVPQKQLDIQQQKMRDSVHAALIGWAKSAGQASDYTDNTPHQCLHPVGHWYELPNLLRNGLLARILKERPPLRYLMLHNIDTLGADLNAAMLGRHIQSGNCLTFEVISRRLEDRGGGLARVNGKVRLLEGLSMPREEDEFGLSYYNSMTTWIDLDQFLAAFGLAKSDLDNEPRVSAAVRDFAARIPTYITLKDVKKRWGHGQEDAYPVAQWEKLWSDMTAVSEITSGFTVVPRARGQQLKEQAQLDGWLRDGSAAYVESLCEWG